MNSEMSWGFPGANFRANIGTLGNATFAAAKVCRLDAHRRKVVVPIAHANGTPEMASRENVRDAADMAERPRSPGPARAAARREGPQTAADRTVGSNLTRFLSGINNLLAEGREPGSNLLCT